MGLQRDRAGQSQLKMRKGYNCEDEYDPSSNGSLVLPGRTF